ncbi:MAG TPA: hypothetical protein VFP72_05770 [Kineosporiaceae bacterium]|nr:hypothetical protein [Kineosporiaceae bacterium]
MTGVAPGVAVPVDRPVGLFDTVVGGHLVRLPDLAPDRAPGPSPRPGPDPAAGLVWACDRRVGGPVRPLPIPDRCRAAEGIPGDAELAGALVAARDGDPAAGAVRPGDPSWPPTTLTWRIVLLPEAAAVPRPDGRPPFPASALWLPLPGRDGEPGSTTTVTALPDTLAERGSRGARCSVGPALVPGPRGRRMLRLPLRPGPLPVAVRLGCTVRVHLPAHQPTGA